MHTQILFDGGSWRIGRFSVHPGDSCFDLPDQVDRDLIVFPGEPIGIQQTGRDWIIADRRLVTEYPAGSVYRRRSVAGAGDDCIWFQFPRKEVFAAASAAGAGGIELRSYRFCPTGAFFAKEQLLGDLLAGQAPPGAVAPRMRAILVAILCAGEGPPRARGAGPTASHRQLAADARALLAARYREQMSLDELADELSCSPSHLSRVFAAETGQTLHRYRTQLRLRAAAVAVRAGESSLTRLAFSLGFASHSHLTATFRQEFGCPPSRLRPGGRSRD